MKQKTRKSAKKRIKITGNKKLLRRHANTSHNKAKKNKSRQRRQKEPATFNKGFTKSMRKQLGI